MELLSELGLVSELVSELELGLELVLVSALVSALVSVSVSEPSQRLIPNQRSDPRLRCPGLRC